MDQKIDDVARIIAKNRAPDGKTSSRREVISVGAKVAGAVLASTGAGALLARSTSAATRYCNQAPCYCRGAADPSSPVIRTLNCGAAFDDVLIQDPSTLQGTSCGITNRAWYGFRINGVVRCFIHSGAVSSSPVTGLCCNQRRSGETTPAGG